MLKGLVLAASVTTEWKTELGQNGLSWVEMDRKEPSDFLCALEQLQAGKQEVLCLVETDQEEQTARGLGLLCIGYLNPACPGEALSGCSMLLEGFEEADKRFLEQVHKRMLGLPVEIAKTQRLQIREMCLEDLEALNALYQEEEKERFFPEFTADREEQAARLQAYIDGMYGFYQFGMWIVVEKKSGELIGRAGFGIAEYPGCSGFDFGYFIGQAYRRQGYAEEACRAVLAYADEHLELEEINAYVEEDNLPSVRLAEKLGFSREREFLYQGRVLQHYCRRKKLFVSET